MKYIILKKDKSKRKQEGEGRGNIATRSSSVSFKFSFAIKWEISFPGDKSRRKDIKMPVGGRVAGKVGIYSSHYNGNVDVDIVLLGIYDGHIGAKAIFDVNGDILRT